MRTPTTAVRLRARVPSIAPALVSVWRGLTVWVGRTDGFWRFWWDTGRRTADRPVYATHDVSDPATAARRVARPFFEVRERWPHADMLAESNGLRWSL